MKDLWNSDPKQWEKKSLVEMLGLLREFHCVGPCRQSSSVLGISTNLDTALKETIRQLNHMHGNPKSNRKNISYT